MTRAPLSLALVLFSCGGAVMPKGPADAGPADAGSCRWPELDCARVEAMALPALPPARGNRFADDENAAALGYQLFFDLDTLSPAAIRCASCHVPEQGFTTHVGQPRGVSLAPRNALSLLNAARTYPHFWDGSADSLWSQALVAIERDDELGGDRLSVAHHVTTSYAAAYAAVFGAAPDLSALPANGKPGVPAWDSLAVTDQQRVDEVFVNTGKALEAYVRKLARGEAAIDRFIAGDDSALTGSQRAGLGLFVQAGCVQCHLGPNFSDGRFHRLDAPQPTDPVLAQAAASDPGRSAGIAALLHSEFNAASAFYDRPAGEPAQLDEDLTSPGDGFFLTPSLRNVALTGPWGHAGVFASLEDVVRFHLGGGGPRCEELTAHELTDAQVAQLVDFLGALTGDPAGARWTSWPGAYNP